MSDPCQRCGGKSFSEAIIDIQTSNGAEIMSQIYPLCKSCFAALLNYIRNFNDLKVNPWPASLGLLKPGKEGVVSANEWHTTEICECAKCHSKFPSSALGVLIGTAKICKACYIEAAQLFHNWLKGTAK